jgi:hypothetical protein
LELYLIAHLKQISLPGSQVTMKYVILAKPLFTKKLYLIALNSVSVGD